MTNTEVRSIIERITYKPNWRIYVEESVMTWRLCVVVTMNVIDSIEPGRGIVPIISKRIFESDYFWSEEHVIHYMTELIHELEVHEMNEWLKFDGKLLRDPHPKEK